MSQDIIKNIPLKLNINAGKRLNGSVDVSLYSRDIATGQFEFTLVDENNNPIELDETYSAQALVKYKDEEKTYLDDMAVEGNIIRFIFPHDFIIKDGVVTIYIYITKDNYTSDVAALSFNVYRSEIDDIATDIVTVYDKNYEDILTEFEQTLVDYKLTLPKADSVRADIDAILNSFNEDSQTKLNQYDTDVQQAIADNQTTFELAESVRNEAEESRVQDEAQRESAESNRISAESIRASAESERVQAEVERKANEESRELAEDERENAEVQRKIDHANRSAELAGKANKKQEDWKPIPLTNGWTNHLSAYSSAEFYKDQFGVVHLRGHISGGTGPVIGYLPVGYRPAKYEFFLVLANLSNGTHATRTIALYIAPTGEIRTYLSLNEISSGYSSMVSLSPISYRVGV